MTALRSTGPLLVIVAVMAGGIAAWEGLVRSGSSTSPERPPVPTRRITAPAGDDAVWPERGRPGRNQSGPDARAPGTTHRGPPIAPATALPMVRVNLTPSPARRLTVAIDGPYTVRPVGSPQVLGGGERLAACAVIATGTGLKIGGTNYPVERIELVPQHSPALWVDDHQYRGRVRLLRQTGGTVLAVNVVPLEEYLASVVDSEMPAAFPTAARQAQAIAARTYVLSHRANGHPLFDVYSTTRSQRYLGYQYRDETGRRLAGESDSSRRVVRQTQGMVCTYQGRLFCTYYSAVCGGETTPGPEVFADAAPPLCRVPCRWCEAADRYRWTVRVPRDALADGVRRVLRARDRSFGSLVSLTHGGAETFRVSDGRQTHEISGTELRRALPSVSLPSPRFTLRAERDTVIIEGRGHGHGVGLCQWGARGQALAGRSAAEILHHYYPGAEIVPFTSANLE